MSNTVTKAGIGLEYDKILVPVNGEQADQAAIKLACSLSKFAKKSKGSILVVYVVQVRRSLPLEATIEAEVQKAEQTVSEAENIASDFDCNVETDILQARDVGVAIVDEAMERRVNLIVMGAGYKKRLGVTTISPNVLTVLRDAHCGVLLIRPALAEAEGK